AVSHDGDSGGLPWSWTFRVRRPEVGRHQLGRGGLEHPARGSSLLDTRRRWPGGNRYRSLPTCSRFFVSDVSRQHTRLTPIGSLPHRTSTGRNPIGQTRL